MDIQDTGKTLIVDGATFHKLSPNDRAQLMSHHKANRRAAFKADMIEQGIEGEKIVNELDAFDASIFGDRAFFDYVQSAEGRARIIALACKKSNPDETKAAAILDGLTLDLDDDFMLAARLGGVRLQPAKVAKDDDAGNAPADIDAEVEAPRPSVAGS